MADSYSSFERRFLGPVRGLVLRLYSPLVHVLALLGVSPNAVSCLGPLFGLLFVYCVQRNPRLSMLVWAASVMVDGVDGALARSTGRASDFGALVDQFADHTREVLIVVGLAAAGALLPLWGGLYPFVYTALNVTLFLANYYGTPVPLAVKSWVVLYPAIAVYLLGGPNYLDGAAAVSVALMASTVLYGLFLLSRKMGRAPVN